MGRKISEPIEIRGMKLKNRVAFAPILGMLVPLDGSANSETIRWQREEVPVYKRTHFPGEERVVVLGMFSS